MVTSNILNEMIHTEHNYRKILAVTNTIRTNLLERAKIDLDALDQNELSKGLDLIQRISEKQTQIELLFKALKANLISNDNTLMTELNLDSFNDIINSLKTALAHVAKDYANYSIFYENYSKNIAPKLDTDKLQRAINRAGGNHLSLSSLLINPIQRFPRYVMLFIELNKHIPQNHLAKQAVGELVQSTQETCQGIDSVSEFFANIKQSYAGINLLNDSTFRRNVKNYLNGLMTGIHQESPLADTFNALDLTIASKGKRFSNKRTYSFSSQSNQKIFDIIVNRNAMSFRFTEHFDRLPVNEKIALFRLQYFLTMGIENNFKAISVNNATKRHLEILGEVDYYQQPSITSLDLDDEDYDEDEETEMVLSPSLMPTAVEEESSVTPCFRQHLNTLFTYHKGLTRQGSLLKQVSHDIENANAVINTNTNTQQRWRLPGLAK